MLLQNIFFFKVLLNLEVQQHHKRHTVYLKKTKIKRSRNRCLLNVSTSQTFSIKMPGISTLYLEGYFKHKYVSKWEKISYTWRKRRLIT